MTYLTICPTCQKSNTACSCDKAKTDNVIYTGPNLPNSGVETNDNMTLVVQKLNDIQLTSTTSTSSSTSTSTSTSSSTSTTSTTAAPTTTTTTTIIPYNVITGLISQSGTGNPTIAALYKNTFGNILLTRIGIGTYNFIFMNPPKPVDDIGHLWIDFSNSRASDATIVQTGGTIDFANQLILQTFTGGGVAADNRWGQTPFEIRYYNTVTSFPYTFSQILRATALLACGDPTLGTLYSSSSTLVVGSKLYTSQGQTLAVNGGNQWLKSGTNAYQINAGGVISTITAC